MVIQPIAHMDQSLQAYHQVIKNQPAILALIKKRKIFPQKKAMKVKEDNENIPNAELSTTLNLLMKVLHERLTVSISNMK